MSFSLWASGVTVARFAWEPRFGHPPHGDPTVLHAGGTLELPPVRADMGIVKWVLRETIDARTGGPRCRGRPVFLLMRPLGYCIDDRRMTPDPPGVQTPRGAVPAFTPSAGVKLG